VDAQLLVECIRAGVDVFTRDEQALHLEEAAAA
jgi:hypothetical protein